MDLNMALIKADILMAKQGIEIYENNNVREVKNMAAYHLQQAAEKLIKIQVYRSNIEYDNRQIYVHNLSKLLSYANGLNINLNVPNEIVQNSITISEWEAGSRYDLHFKIRIDTLKKFYTIIYDWYDAIYKTGIR